LLRAATFFVLLLTALIFPAILGGADQVIDGAPPKLLEWPMLPGDSLRQLAQLIYPQDRAMQRHFIGAAIRENPATFSNFGADRKFDQETLIWLPDLKQLANSASSSRSPRHFLRPVRPAMQPSALAEIETLMARNQALKAEQDKLDVRITALKASITEMQEMIARDRRRISPPSSRPVVIQAVPPKPAGDSLLSPSPFHLLSALAIILVSGGIIWLRRRSKSAGVLPKPLTMPSTPSTQMEVTVPPERANVATPAQQVTDEKFRPDESVIMVGEIDSIVEEAKVFVALGRSERAIEVLEEYISAHPRASANPWLYLLDFYRSVNRPEDFTVLAKRFHQAFNVIAPQWESSDQKMMVVPCSLSEFPHILSRLCDSWGTLDAQDFLNHLLQDNRGGERQGFSMEVLQEILLLLAILEMRDHMPPLSPF
jgi:hypothetical protein